MQLADRSIVSGRLANMLRLLIQHGGIQGGFEAAAEAAAHGFNAALVVLHGEWPLWLCSARMKVTQCLQWPLWQAHLVTYVVDCAMCDWRRRWSGHAV
jgi:hypothetical protein